MKRTPKLPQILAAGLALLLLGFIAGCDPVYPGPDVHVSSECTGICEGTVPSSFDAIPTKAAQGQYQYTKHQLPGYRQGATVYTPQGVSRAGALVFCPPYTGSQFMYAAWGPFFASNGIILVTIDTRTVMDQVDQRDDQQWAAVEALRSDPDVQGILDPDRIGVTGWSMGGGATWINAQTKTPKTAMSLAGHNMTAGSTSKGRKIQCPTLLFNGATDISILGGLGQSEGVFNAIPDGIAKEIYVVSSAGHFDWGSPTMATADVARVALAFQKTFLHNDGRWAKFLEEKPTKASTWANNIVVD